MIADGTLTPDCNFEVEYSNYDSNSLKNEEDLFKILKEFLWHRCDRDPETYLMLDLNISDNEGEQFKDYVVRVGVEKIEPLLEEFKEIPELNRESLNLYMDWTKTVKYQLERGEGECAV